MTPRWCMQASNVEVVCTTEDPIDPLDYHQRLRQTPSFSTKILSAFRPDKAFYCERPAFREYLPQLAKASGILPESFHSLMQALEQRLVFFKNIGSMISDNGIEDFQWADYTEHEIEKIFSKAAAGESISTLEVAQYRSAFLINIAELYNKHGFIMQLHIGTYQGANKSKEASIGAACGFDCTDDSTPIKSVGALLDRLTRQNTLPKTILYPLNPGSIEPYAILAAGFCEEKIRGKVQLGAPWWFNDQAYGINRQFEAAANLYPISLSVGMLTDSRSFLSYPRHELYRRILCDYFGRLIERGEYFSGEAYLAEVIRGICYKNAKEFFGL